MHRLRSKKIFFYIFLFLIIGTFNNKNLNDINFPNIKTKEDYVVWLYLSKSGIQMMGLNENLTSWRKLNNSLSSSVIQKICDGYKVYRKFLKFNVFKNCEEVNGCFMWSTVLVLINSILISAGISTSRFKSVCLIRIELVS